jgi:hypothetical protein
MLLVLPGGLLTRALNCPGFVRRHGRSTIPGPQERLERKRVGEPRAPGNQNNAQGPKGEEVR